MILGIPGKTFSDDPRTEFGMALTLAESEAGDGTPALTRQQNGVRPNYLTFFSTNFASRRASRSVLIRFSAVRIALLTALRAPM